MILSPSAKFEVESTKKKRIRSDPMEILIPRGSSPHSDQEALALSYLLERTAHCDDAQHGHWISIHSSKWESVLGANYSRILKSLVERGRVEINPRYSTDRFPKSYRLSGPFRVPNFERFPLSRRRSSQSSIRIPSNDTVGMGLVERLKRLRLPTDLDVRGWNLIAAFALFTGRLFACRCQYGRFHSPITGLSRELRGRLTTDLDEPVLEVDISNCQPLLLGLMAVAHAEGRLPLSEGECPLSSLLREKSIYSERIKYTHHPPPTYSICSRVSATLGKYLELCQLGELYDSLLSHCAGMTLFDFIPPEVRHQYTENRLIDRDLEKSGFLVMLFSEYSMTERLPLFQIVEREFPEIAQFILQAKQHRYQELARGCQRFESRILIDGVSHHLMEAHPEVAFATVHDSFLIPVSVRTGCENLIREQFSQFGVTPHLKVAGPTTRP